MSNETEYGHCVYCGKFTVIAKKGSYRGLCHKCMIKKDTGDYILGCMPIIKRKK